MEKESKDEQTQQDTAEITGDYIAKVRRSSRNRESYDEIAELEAELRRAYIAKELRAQLLERETERYIENVRKQRAARLMRQQQQAVLEDDVRQRSESLKKSEDYRNELTGQIKRKEEERNMMMEEARREREILTEVDKIREQCERTEALKVKNELVDSTRRERLILQEMKEIRRQEEMEAEAKKLYEDEEYLKEIDRRAKNTQKLRAEQMQKRERTLREIANVLINMENQKQERETLIAELIAEDVKCELLIKEEENWIRRRKMREELAADLEEQILFTEQCKLRFIEQDRTFAEEIMKKIMEDEKTARLTAAAKRRMQLQYRDDLARLIEARRKFREEEISNMEEAAKEENRRDEIRMDRVREERRRLLETHVLNVAEYLNKRALTEEEQTIVAQPLKTIHDADPTA